MRKNKVIRLILVVSTFVHSVHCIDILSTMKCQNIKQVDSISSSSSKDFKLSIEFESRKAKRIIR